MSDKEFNDGGDVLGSSEYFTGGCGCGGVEGGSPWSEGGALQTSKNLVGLTDFGKAYDIGSSNLPHALTYVTMGLVKACVIVLIVLLFLGFERDHWSMILLYVVIGLSAVGNIAAEVIYAKSMASPAGAVEMLATQV